MDEEGESAGGGHVRQQHGHRLAGGEVLRPVAISANTTYVASYYAPKGRYAVSENYFATSGVNSGPLRALANGQDGGNGVYRYQTGGGYPTQTYRSSNYWVDVLFTTAVASTPVPILTPNAGLIGDTQPPTVTMLSPLRRSPAASGTSSSTRSG